MALRGWAWGWAGFFAQPEVAYSAVLGQVYGLTYFSRPSVPVPNVVIFTPKVRRFEVAALAGMRLGKRGYLLAGPVLAYHLRQTYDDASAAYAPLVQRLYDSVVPVQLLAQGGVGTTLWRFDASARYEHGLTPYTRKFTYAGQQYAYRQSTSQVILNLGFLLYDSRRLSR